MQPVERSHSDCPQEKEKLFLSSPNKTDSVVGTKKKLIFSNPTNDNSTQKTEKVKLWRKLAYAIGSMAYSMTNTVISFYLSIFLLEVAILDPVYVLIIVFSGRICDAITDPLVGFLCSRTRTRIGKLRPWLIGAVVPGAAIYTFLWFVPPVFDSRPSYVKFIYYLLFYLAFQATLTCIHVPYTALTMHMSHDNKERDSVTLYRMGFEVFGTLLGILVFTVFYTGFGNSDESGCEEGGKRVPDLNKRRAFLYHALTIGILVILFVSLTFIAVKEQKDNTTDTKKISFFSGIKEVFTFKPYVLLLCLELFSWLAIQFVTGNAALFVKYAVGLESQFQFVIAVLLVSTVAWMPVWHFIIKFFGKKTAFFIGMWVLMLFLLSLLFVSYVTFLVYPIVIIGGFGVSAAYLLPWSMLPDVVDEATLTRNSRREELFYAYFVFGNKFAGGVTLGISTALYKIMGYDEESCVQPWTVGLGLKLLVSVPPIFFILISLIFLHYYPITEKTRERTKMLLAARRKSSNEDCNKGHVEETRSISIAHRSQESYSRASSSGTEDKQSFL